MQVTFERKKSDSGHFWLEHERSPRVKGHLPGSKNEAWLSGLADQLSSGRNINIQTWRENFMR